MVRNIALGVLLLALSSVLAVAQQDRCAQPSNQNKVGCTLITLYNVPSYIQAAPSASSGTLPIYQGGKPASDSGFDFTSNPALPAALGTELTTLPLTAPASGFVYQYDAATGLEARSTQSLGPILTERGNTIGRHKLFVAFAYQYFKFGSQDGVSTRSLHTVIQHAQETPPAAEDADLVTTNDSIDLKIHQFTGFVTFGVTDRIDVSVVVPVLNVRLGAYSAATIHNFDGNPRTAHSFCNQTTPCITSSFSKFNYSSGVGDLVLRVKAKVWNGEHAKLAVGSDIRLPTGDAMNFRGSGTYGVRPFAALSYSKKRFAPHANLGFEVNGDSILAGDINKGTKAHLPNELTYSLGADFGVTPRLTLAADWLGERIVNGFRIRQSSCTESNYNAPGTPAAKCIQNGNPGTCITQPCTFPWTIGYPQGLPRSSYSINDFSVGVKVSPVKNLLVTGNAIVKLDDSGLRSKVIPLVGIGYTF